LQGTYQKVGMIFAHQETCQLNKFVCFKLCAYTFSMLKNQHLQNCHELFNNHFFDGQLNYISILETDYIELYGFECWGYYDGECIPNEIVITNNGKIYLTLLHEMVHQWQKEFDLNDQDHGRDFKRMARFIEITLNIKKGTI